MKRANTHFVGWALGLLSALTVLGVGGTARTLMRHELAIGILMEHCPECRRALAEAPRDRAPSVWSTFGFAPALPPLPPRKEHRETKTR